MHKALWWKPTDKNSTVQCELCPSLCVIKDGHAGICRIRKNDKGILYTLLYDKYTSVSLDPIEKKPLFHFLPGMQVLSLGTIGCNMRCPWCQNYDISQASPGEVPTRQVSSEVAIELAREYASPGISYTYNEPLINYEYVLDTARLAHKQGLKNMLVTNGYIQEKPFAELLPFIDAANIDLKSFSEDFYVKYCGGHLESVLKTIEMMIKEHKHVEVTTLVIPGLNDSDEEIRKLTSWLAGQNKFIAYHLSRYYPAYKFHEPATPLATMHRLRDVAHEKLQFVYLGNVPEEPEQDTACPDCGHVIISRRGYMVELAGLTGKNCANCGRTTEDYLK